MVQATASFKQEIYPRCWWGVSVRSTDCCWAV